MDMRTYSEKHDVSGNEIPLPDDYEGQLIPTSISRRDVSINLTDPITRKKYTCGENEYGYHGFDYNIQTDVLISFLKARVPDMTVTNFFIVDGNRKGSVSSRDIEYIFNLNSWDDAEKIKSIQKEIKKNNVAVCTTQAWDEMYVLPGGNKLDNSNDDIY